MSTRREDDSRPPGGATSQRNTARDVPVAKFKESSVGTVAPRALRGPSLLPGQGAPERIAPEDVELAVVLREADTLDRAHVARATVPRPRDARSPSPVPISVDLPRARARAPSLDEQDATPPAPSARSIQSGTLMSIGSIDPRAPTELSLPGPRPLSVSEAYLRPEAVVVVRTSPQAGHEVPGAVDTRRSDAVAQRSYAPPPSEPIPASDPLSESVRSGAVSSARPSSKLDSVAPVAQRYARPPRSYSPVSSSSDYPPPPSPLPRSQAQGSFRSAPISGSETPPPFEIHSELAALQHDFQDDVFDLRSASTQREPLASRRPLESAEWTPHGPWSESGRRDSESGAPFGMRGPLPAAFLGDRRLDLAQPIANGASPQRASVPVSWVLGAAAFSLLLALLVAWVLRPMGVPEPGRIMAGQGPTAAPSVASVPPLRDALPITSSRTVEPRVHAAGSARSKAAAVRSASAVPTAAPGSDLPAAGGAGRRSIY